MLQTQKKAQKQELGNKEIVEIKVDTPLVSEEELELKKVFNHKYVSHSPRMGESQFNSNRDLLVIPAGFSDKNLPGEIKEMLSEMRNKNRVIELKYIKKPAVVRAH